MFNLYFLKYFCDSCFYKSISPAAKKNRVSSAAVSLAIRKLEEYFETELILHQKNRFELTPDGKKLELMGNQLFDRIYEFKNEIGGSVRKEITRVNFATTHSIASSILPRFAKRVLKNNPNLIFNFKAGDPLMIEQWVDQDLVDFGISFFRKRSQAVTKDILYEGNFVVVRSSAKLRIKEDLKYIVTEPVQETKDFLGKYEKHYGKYPTIAMYAQSWEVIKNMVEEGLGLGLVPDYMLKFAKRKNNLERVHFPFELPPYSLSLIQKKEKSLPTEATLLLELLKEFLLQQ